ncbi:SDR family NAD(P)-dependent oxidoreductase [Aurantibacter sp.]|uniref:SDR family NAD(P)-dependent oxidoreductase n=1 Tax=Aurantibacter sp. TaxID=2807103 RepID=UPI003267AE2C
MNRNSQPRVVLITGANRGMGLGYVKHYLNNGYSVIATYKDVENTKELQFLKKNSPKYLKIIKMNVAEEKSILAMKKILKIENIALSLVINNAGISENEDFGNWTSNAFLKHFKVNTIGPALVSQMVTPFMCKNSKIIQITSGMGSLYRNINATSALDAYAASKCALHSITVRLAEKVRHKNIGVFLINPGWVKTVMGGEEATYAISEAVSNITKVIYNLTIKQTGSFVSENGESIPW